MTPTEHLQRQPSIVPRPAPAGRLVHESCCLLRRHMHAGGFIAVVLSGSYVEAGDTGRHSVGPGDVLVHRPYEWHLDRICSSGAEVLVLPLDYEWPEGVLGSVRDADEIARIAANDVTEARAALIEAMVEKTPAIADWPDLLAQDLIADPDLELTGWALRNGLHPGSLSRGFSRQFSIAPDSFRAVVRARRAIEQILSSRIPLSGIASDQGFSDQAHMSRTIKRLTGLAPNALRNETAAVDRRAAAA